MSALARRAIYRRTAMTGAISNELVRREGRLLFALLDAAEENGLLEDTAYELPWLEAKAGARQSENYQTDADLYFDLLSGLAASGRLAGSWIEARWLAVKSRVAGAN